MSNSQYILPTQYKQKQGAESTAPSCSPSYVQSGLWRDPVSSRKETEVAEAAKGDTAQGWKQEKQLFMEQAGIT